MEEPLKIKGICIATAVGVFAEVRDIRHFSSHLQLQKLAGLAIPENSSGKHKGRAEISRRGRVQLRDILFRVVLPLVENAEFKNSTITSQQGHKITKENAVNNYNMLQAVSSVLCSSLQYSAEKMLADIHRDQLLKAA